MLHVELGHDLTDPLLGICPKKWKAGTFKKAFY
jgi:hypothetical protein